ncbi:MAG: FtsX-like permease family protein [Bacillota bacterium]|nr:FtsX-like permease family protein [Bacillota bacterium]
MHKWFYTKMAIGNIGKNRKIILPYLIMSVGIISMFYIMHAIAVNEGLASLPGAMSIIAILFFGTVVIGIFSSIFMFYTNSFLIKQRKKEIGLYNILGLEKKHIAKMLSIETLFIALTALALGLFGGIVLSKLMFMILLKLLGFDVTLKFTISGISILVSVVLFGGIFLSTLLFNIGHIHLARPIELLKGGNLGEREPKSKWIMALIGAISLGAGYYIAQTVESPLEAIFMFFIAVVLVMIGTYLLFTTGSIVMLKILRRNKDFYYKTKNFTSVSGMIYRMKQNAVGLANICILSTAVLVSLSTTVSLYMGMEDVLESRYPHEIGIMIPDGIPENQEKVTAMVHRLADERNVELEHFNTVRTKGFPTVVEGNEFTVDLENGFDYKMSFVQLVPLEDFNLLENSSTSLQENEVLIYTNLEMLGLESIVVGGNEFLVKEELSDSLLEPKTESALAMNIYVVVEDIETLHHIYNTIYSEEDQTLDYISSIDVAGTEEAELAFNYGVYGGIAEFDFAVRADSRMLSKDSFLSAYGGFLFLGIFLGTLFLMATVLIIYYKQISEGYDDKVRFDIMQKVGMDESEVKSTIKRQIVMVFFMPLIAAIVHISFAFNVIVKMLALFGFSNISLFMICTAVTVLIFAIIYFIVYALTARAYYKIVQ